MLDIQNKLTSGTNLKDEIAYFQELDSIYQEINSVFPVDRKSVGYYRYDTEVEFNSTAF